MQIGKDLRVMLRLVIAAVIVLFVMAILAFFLGWNMKEYQVNKRLLIDRPIPGHMYVVDSTDQGLLIVLPSENYGRLQTTSIH